MSGPAYTEPIDEEPEGPRPVDRAGAREQRAGAHARADAARDLAAALAEAGLTLRDLKEGT